MQSNYFFRINWLIQLLVGMGLFIVSFTIQNQTIQAFLATPALALGVTLALETGKALAIIWHRYMTSFSRKQFYPLSTRLASSVFRLGLVVLSLLCSQLFLANQLDRPQLEIVRKAELQTVQTTLDNSLKQSDQKEAKQLNQLHQRQKLEYADLKQQHQDRIEVLQTSLNKEMNNVVSGVFKGKRYLEFERLLEQEKALLAAELTHLSQRHLQQTMILTKTVQNEASQQRKAVQALAHQQKTDIIANDYATDERVNEPHIVSFLKLVQSVFRVDILPLQFVFIFSILLSLLIEIGIFLSFDTITIALIPSIKAKHRSDKETDKLKANMENKAKQDHAHHESELDHVAKRTERTIEEAESLYDRFSEHSKW
jgi:uncharacterized membrane protein YciS (DUF1049 family)